MPFEYVPQCETVHVHDEVVHRVHEILPPEEALYDLAELYKVFGDSTRIKILYVLFESEMCVCDIAETLDMSISAISHQLRVLKNSRLVSFRREGKTIIYSLADDHVRTILDQGMEHIGE
ncbi:MAG: helix-turn-helix transcriptional regulator [Clostridia bacterium]|nr:helix-turn-helix transcriptional regulator [Clostridia bacterium]